MKNESATAIRARTSLRSKRSRTKRTKFGPFGPRVKNGARMRKANTRCPNFVRFVRERLLRRLRADGPEGGLIPYNRFQCYVHRRHLRSSLDMPYIFDMLFKRLFNCERAIFHGISGRNDK